MLTNRMLGIPLVIWGVAALVVAVVWVFVWPADKAAEAAPWQVLVLRWGHMAVWLLLAAAAFAAAAGQNQAAQVLGWLAFATYGLFMAVMLGRG